MQASGLNSLAPFTIEVLRKAALLESEFTVVHLAATADQSVLDIAAPVTEAVAAGVLIEAGDRLTIGDAQVRLMLREATPLHARQLLHSRAAHMLAREGAPVEQIAHHLLASGLAIEDAWPVSWICDHAGSLGTRAPEMATVLFASARGLLLPGDPRLNLLHSQSAVALLRLGRLEEAAAIATAVLGRTADADFAGRAGWVLAEVLRATSDWLSLLDRARQILGTPGLAPMWIGRIRALCALAILYTCGPDSSQAEAACARDAAQLAGDRYGVALAIHVLSLVQAFRGDHEMALAHIDESLAILGAHRETVNTQLLLTDSRVVSLINLGRFAEARRALVSELHLAESAGSRSLLDAVRVRTAEHNLITGRWDEALAELDGVDDMALTAICQLQWRGVKAQIALHRQDRQQLADSLEGMEAMAHADSAARQHAERLLMVWVLAAERPHDGINRWLTIYGRTDTAKFAFTDQIGAECAPAIVRLALDFGDVGIAQAVTGSVSRSSLPIAAAVTEHCLGLLADDPERILAAQEAFAQIDLIMPCARAAEDAAVAYARLGNLPVARGCYNLALGVYIELKAAWDIRRARSCLRPLGVRPSQRRRRPSSGWPSLTPTESTVAQLVADGMSNPDIAAQLFLSRRTVEAHMSRILAKLDASSRIDIARHALAVR
jgi:DNA-binding CsgD family transcriptional regulator